MIPPGPAPTIRPADPAEYPWLEDVERQADRLFLDVGYGTFPEHDASDHWEGAAAVLAVGDPAVGFARVEVLDGTAHLGQLAVVPAAGRRGLGTALVGAVVAWAGARGYPSVTLTTFRDVPWNAPFYRRLDFVEVAHPTGALAELRRREVADGVDAMGPRLAMARTVSGAGPGPR